MTPRFESTELTRFRVQSIARSYGMERDDMVHGPGVWVSRFGGVSVRLLVIHGEPAIRVSWPGREFAQASAVEDAFHSLYSARRFAQRVGKDLRDNRIRAEARENFELAAAAGSCICLDGGHPMACSHCRPTDESARHYLGE